MSDKFEGGCPNCGYGTPQEFAKMDRCPFCEARVRAPEEEMDVQKERNFDLEAAVVALRDAVDAEMKARHDRPGNVIRDVILTRLLRERPELGQAIEAASDSDPLYKATAEGPSVVRAGIEAQVAKRTEEILAAEPTLKPYEARARAWTEDPATMRLYHAPGAELPGTLSVAALAKGRGKATLDAAVAELSKTLAPGDPVLGMQLVSKRFPRLVARWRGAA